MQDLSTIKEGVNNAFSFLDLEDEHEAMKKIGSKQLKIPIKGNI